MRRLLQLGLLAAALMTPLTACGEDPKRAGQKSAPISTQSPTPKAADLLADASAKLDGQSLKFTIEDPDDPPAGGYDAATGAVFMAGLSDGDKVEFRLIGSDLYVLGADPRGRWLHVLPAKLPDGSPFLIPTDPLFIRKYLTAATDVKQDPPGTFTGKLDMTKYVGGGTAAAQRLANHIVKSAGAKASAIAFTATVDAQGRLASVQATFPAADDGTDLDYHLKITEVGATVTVAKPPKAKIVEAPASFYRQ